MVRLRHPTAETPHAPQARLPRAVSLHPAARAARPWRRRQRPRALGATPPARGAAPPDSTAQARTRRSGAARRRQPGAAPRPLVVLLGAARDVAALASAPDCRRVDLPTPDRPATAQPGGAAADRPPGQGESALGLPAHPRRAATPRHAGIGHRDPHDAAASRAGPGTATHGHHLAGVPAPAGRRDRRLRLLHRRYGVAAPAVRAVLRRTRHPPDPLGRGDRQPQRCLGRPAGPQPAAGAWRARSAGTLRAARPGRQVLPQLRCGVPGGGRRGARDPGESAQGERVRRALGADRPRRVPGLAADRRPRPPRAGPSGLRRALQHPSPHWALALQAPAPDARLAVVADDQPARVHRRDLLGGLMHEYRRAA